VPLGEAAITDDRTLTLQAMDGRSGIADPRRIQLPYRSAKRRSRTIAH